MDYNYIQKRENNCRQAKDKNGKSVSIDDVHHGSYAYCQYTFLRYGKPMNAEKGFTS